jgi:hypothetical protein
VTQELVKSRSIHAVAPEKPNMGLGPKITGETMRALIAFSLILIAPDSGYARDYYELGARLTEKGAVLARIETKTSVGDTVKFSRSGGKPVEFSITLKESALGGVCLEIAAALEGSWGKGNASSACRPFEIGVPLKYSVVDVGVLHIDLKE